MTCEAGARSSICLSKAPSSLEKRPRNLARLPHQVGSRRKKSGRSQKSAFSQKTSRFSPFIVVHNKGSALRWPVDHRATLHPRQIWCFLTQQYVQQRACACCGTLSGFPRQYHYLLRATRSSRKPHWRLGEAHLAKPSRHNQAAIACQPIG